MRRQKTTFFSCFCTDSFTALKKMISAGVVSHCTGDDASALATSALNVLESYCQLKPRNGQLIFGDLCSLGDTTSRKLAPCGFGTTTPAYVTAPATLRRRAPLINPLPPYFEFPAPYICCKPPWSSDMEPGTRVMLHENCTVRVEGKAKDIQVCTRCYLVEIVLEHVLYAMIL